MIRTLRDTGIPAAWLGCTAFRTLPSARPRRTRRCTWVRPRKGGRAIAILRKIMPGRRRGERPWRGAPDDGCESGIVRCGRWPVMIHCPPRAAGRSRNGISSHERNINRSLRIRPDRTLALATRRALNQILGESLPTPGLPRRGPPRVRRRLRPAGGCGSLRGDGIRGLARRTARRARSGRGGEPGSRRRYPSAPSIADAVDVAGRIDTAWTKAEARRRGIRSRPEGA
ncbi:MAG: hypothetical protein JWM27_4333 [Gemmatimonadetes bacterium]|nr:hypothetical protein [Gemmatimonadota bacterium]